MKNILFLDFDGPMFPNRALFLEENIYPQGKEVCESMGIHPFFEYWKMDPVAVNMIHRLYNLTPFDLVISSSWAGFNDKDIIEKLLNKNNFDIPIHEDWRSFLPEKNRLEEITEWLNRNEVDNYLIIDDHGSGYSLVNCDLENIILVNEDNGIDLETYLKMTKIIATWESKKNHKKHMK